MSDIDDNDDPAIHELDDNDDVSGRKESDIEDKTKSKVQFDVDDVKPDGDDEEEEATEGGEDAAGKPAAISTQETKSRKSLTTSGEQSGGDDDAANYYDDILTAAPSYVIDGAGGSDEDGEDEDEDEEEERDEEEEEEDEDEDEEEEDDEEEEEEEEEEEGLSPEEEAELARQKQELIDRYLIGKKEYKYMVKKNAYLQDKLYKICVRKGFIVENKGAEEEEQPSKKKKRRFTTSTRHDDEEGYDEGEDEDEDAWEAVDPHDGQSGGGGGGGEGGGRGIKNFMVTALESKYGKIVKKIWQSEQSKMNDAVVHEINLHKVKEKSEKWNKIHEEKLLDLMDRVRLASESATDSNTGRHLHRWETEQYIEEVCKIHEKLCRTMVKMYQNRHGLEFALKRLEETEVQGEGLQMLEYEQLQAENYSLKEKLEDRQRDVENIKAKIAHAVQILAHFRECMHKLQEKMDDGNSKLALINKRVYQVREITDVVTQRYELFKEEEKGLMAESGLLDNTKLLRDFEKTHYDVLELKEGKRKLQKQLFTKIRQVEELQTKIRDIQLNLPELQKLAEAEQQALQLQGQEEDTGVAGTGAGTGTGGPPPRVGPKLSNLSQRAQGQGGRKFRAGSTRSRPDSTITLPSEDMKNLAGENSKLTTKDLKSKNIQRLQWLLSTRNVDPTGRPPSMGITKFPPIANKYKCHFQHI